jgi:oxepin-CoA hydrolase/3-oxo-5,6-dehydrosuberyl-CoA semialdehyde dehydrogenase
MTEEKKDFIKNEFISLIKKLKGDEKNNWGKMNAQQMIEHTSAFFKVSTGKIYFPLKTPPEHLFKYKEFLLSDKEFRENTKAPVLPEEPLPLHYADMAHAVKDLEKSVNDFFEYFENDLAKTTLHPVFGELNFNEWVQLHHKHIMHHLKQFGLLKSIATA